MQKVALVPLAALMLAVTPASAGASTGPTNTNGQVAGACDPAKSPCFRLESTIAFTSTRDNPTASQAAAIEIYLMSPDPVTPNVRRLTYNTDGDAFPALSPDGKEIVFDSNRNRAEGEPVNTSDLFLMNTDGTQQTLLTRGSSATWSPDSKNMAFHASASGTGTPIRTDPGSATTDSDIFVANVDDLLTGVEQPRNITNSPDKIDDDPDWSPDGHSIAFTSHDVTDDPRASNTAEIYALNADGTGMPERLTYNNEEERGPAWSPDGTRIVFSCRAGGGTADFEICVIHADGSGLVQLTDNSVPDLTATWSADGQQIVFHRLVVGQGLQLFVMTPDGTGQTQLSFPPGINLFANWGELRVRDQDASQ
ncbi:WD40-like Beta Propeller Repeat [Micromonospora rhizosphaerae]|uniref:WD40-like Beta Propeller Repeat n=1 Tax=Micromonospora rhizosphaerae TaxID=568872 RepID=A0A1C6T060_9ACTN|nr:PD40 domain-containing protein [Micromonospora rhizosphaerae]SCL35186.1 WD40-like Beta Propeller Repeat [Micromonospora rhizosphaerae]